MYKGRVIIIFIISLLLMGLIITYSEKPKKINVINQSIMQGIVINITDTIKGNMLPDRYFLIEATELDTGKIVKILAPVDIYSLSTTKGIAKKGDVIKFTHLSLKDGQNIYVLLKY